MISEGLRKFNAGYGFPFHIAARSSKNKIFYEGKRENTRIRLLLTIPFFAIIRLKCQLPLKEAPELCSRAILASTIVGLPIIFALDIIATLFTQPIGRALEKRKVRKFVLEHGQ
jgi:hypothetical protein